jgi:hypothetical protein
MANQKTGSEFSASAGFGIGQSHCELTVRKQNALSAFDRLADGFVAMDHEFRYTLINDEAERICQKRRDEMIGRTYWDLFPDLIDTITDFEFRRAMAERVPRRVLVEGSSAPFYSSMQKVPICAAAPPPVSPKVTAGRSMACPSAPFQAAADGLPTPVSR